MPFTPSHAVVALPFVRIPGVPAAIAVGAMTPDLPLFLRGTPISYDETHSFPWLPLTGLIALVLLFVWRCLLRPAVRELAPGWLAARLPGEWDASIAASARETFAPNAWHDRRARALYPAVLAAALMFGVATHIVWDLFTHEGRWGTRVLPVLNDQWGPFIGFKWLQHGSSVVGLAVLGVWAVVWLWRRRPNTVRRALPAGVRWGWWLSLPIMLLGAWVWGVVALGPFTDEWTIPHLAYRVLPPACAVWGVLTLLIAVAVSIARARRR